MRNLHVGFAKLADGDCKVCTWGLQRLRMGFAKGEYARPYVVMQLVYTEKEPDFNLNTSN